MRFFTAIGKLMLGTPLHAAPLVVTTSLPVSPSTAVELRAVHEPDERVGADAVGRRRDGRIVHVPAPGVRRAPDLLGDRRLARLQEHRDDHLAAALGPCRAVGRPVSDVDGRVQSRGRRVDRRRRVDGLRSRCSRRRDRRASRPRSGSFPRSGSAAVEDVESPRLRRRHEEPGGFEPAGSGTYDGVDAPKSRSRGGLVPARPLGRDEDARRVPRELRQAGDANDLLGIGRAARLARSCPP